jgi:hypothetical protein
LPTDCTQPGNTNLRPPSRAHSPSSDGRTASSFSSLLHHPLSLVSNRGNKMA